MRLTLDHHRFEVPEGFPSIFGPLLHDRLTSMSSGLLQSTWQLIRILLGGV